MVTLRITETQLRHASYDFSTYIYVQQTQIDDLSQKQRTSKDTHTLTLKKFDQACKRQGISETESFFLELEAAAISAELGRDELGSI